MLMNPALWLQRSGTLHPERPALFVGERQVADYREFSADAAAIANGLQSGYAIKKGDRIAVFAKNCTQYLEALYGIWWAGAVAVPINAKLHAKETAWIMENSGAKLCLSTADLARELEPVLPTCCEQIIELEGEAFGLNEK